MDIDRTVRLETIMRQQGDAESAFRNTLEAIRSMNCTAGQWELLSTHYQGNLPAATVESFRDSIRVYPTNARVNAYNIEHLEALKEPIINVKATGIGQGWDIPSFRDAGNLDMFSPVCIESRIMLSENICVCWGLVNGAMGTICDVSWKDVVDWRTTPPVAIFVAFDKQVSCMPFHGSC
jgi:hypothetical protein